ncbi:MAG TPA: TIGR03435 family protein, partial [Acidobacteriaceae bacterium]
QQEFQVATVKPSAPDTPRQTQIRGNKFATTGTTLFDLLIYAYNVHASQIVGGPDWMQTAKFDVLADPETEKRPSSDEMKAMVGRLVGDRFHLVLHREKRELPVFAIVRVGMQIKFVRNDSDPHGIPAGALVAPGFLSVRNSTMTNFAAFMQRFASAEISRPVVDQTGIQGHYDFDLHYTPANAPANAQDADRNAPPVLFTAIQEQLGLKLQPTRAPVDVLLVQSVSMPSPN